MIGENRLVGRSTSTRMSGGRSSAASTLVPGHQTEEQAIMARSKPKREKKEETTAEFVKRVNQHEVKHSGLKKNLKGARR